MNRPLVIIPARGNSKGVPGKNIKPLNGKPLLLYTLEAARSVFDDNCIILSTDSEEIKKVAESAGLTVPFLRPESLATDTSGTYEVLMHALKYAEENGDSPGCIVLLQPTSPFRTAAHILGALEVYNQQEDIDMVVAVKKTDANPYYVLYEEDSDGYLTKSKIGDFTRRQDCPDVWELNGSIYIIDVESLKKGPPSTFKKIAKYQMDASSSLDIDTPLDWKLAEIIMGENQQGR